MQEEKELQHSARSDQGRRGPRMKLLAGHVNRGSAGTPACIAPLGHLKQSGGTSWIPVEQQRHEGHGGFNPHGEVPKKVVLHKCVRLDLGATSEKR